MGISKDELRAIEAAFAKHDQRTRYARFTPSILAEIPNAELDMAIVDYMTHSIETDRSLDDIPLGIQAFWVTWIVQAEVNNGGFNQFYCNTADRLSVDAIKAFRYFNANAHADLMQQANAKRANEGATPKSMQADATKQSFVDSYAHSSLSPFDTRFEELQDELTELRHQKIRSVPHEFCDD